MKRYLSEFLQDNCFKFEKIALVSGPRQSGKTTFAKAQLAERSTAHYFNWDQDTFRTNWVKDPSALIDKYCGNIPPGLIVLDEIHKDRLWKRRIKGVYDTKNGAIDLLVTGSARLNVFRRGSDSLVGRAFHFHFHPFTLAEVLGNKPATPDNFYRAISTDSFPVSTVTAQNILDKFMHFGTFPEPYLRQDATFLATWRRARMSQVLYEDVQDISTVQDITKIEILYDLLVERVGSLVGKASLRETLESSFDSITRWINILNALFLTFEVAPFSQYLSRALRRERKVYIWEISLIKEQGARFENLVALHLLKACHLWSDLGIGKFELLFVRTKEQHEIDFLIVRDNKPWLPIEVKLSETSPSPSWRKLLPELKCKQALQLVASSQVHRRFEENGRTLLVRSAADVLSLLV